MRYFVFCLLFCCQALYALELQVTIDGILTTEGVVKVGLYQENEEFHGQNPHYGYIVPAKTEIITVIFKDIPAGRYAIACFHDKNSNQKVDSNLLGFPLEPVCFSNNATINLGAPTFEKAAFNLISSQTMRITLIQP
jgi:uncharacterized protein (DUF2141 family)